VDTQIPAVTEGVAVRHPITNPARPRASDEAPHQAMIAAFD